LLISVLCSLLLLHRCLSSVTQASDC